MQNIEELRVSLLDNYEQMKTKKMDLKMGKELANTAGKIINSLKVELDYNSMIGEKKKIKFLQKS
jgi:hypothetical protein